MCVCYSVFAKHDLQQLYFLFFYLSKDNTTYITYKGYNDMKIKVTRVIKHTTENHRHD